ncbi:MAG: hypothetical protein N2606_04860 [Candidatus Omnitrophica bacterium]|nr:hypothetical protein [Candidatus Omnitrophota bacterium]
MSILPNRDLKIIVQYICLAVLLWLNFYSPANAQQDFIQIPCAIQIASSVSDGAFSIEEIVKAARQCGIKAVILGERDLMQWEYGIWPLRNLLKRTIKEKSLFSFGIKRYLTEIKKIQKMNPDILVITGIESAPFYYWQGEFWDNDFSLKNWHKHLLCIGFEDSKVIERLPVIGNKKGLAKPISIKDILLLWPVLLIIFAVAIFRRMRQREHNKYRIPQVGLAIGLILLAVAFLLNNWPFRRYWFNQYQGDLKHLPYQRYIDYVVENGGLVFWLHPDTENISKDGPINIETRRYSFDLYRTHNYTGFALLYDGLKYTGAIGGVWDGLLNSSLKNTKRKPVWAIGALGIDEIKDLKEAILYLRTVVFAKDFTKEAVLEALRNGRLYILQGKRAKDFLLEELNIFEPKMFVSKTIGQSLEIEKGRSVHLRLRGKFLNRPMEKIKVKLVKNGQLIKTLEVETPFEVVFQENDITENTFYRLIIEAKDLLVFTNPVFVKLKFS